MSNGNLNRKIRNGTKWSILAEILAKIMMPITSMILARFLTPEAFGVVATIVMVISFADMFSDAGFQKFLIQRQFTSDKNKQESTTVAFWTNIFISFSLWGLIVVFRDELAELVGNPGLGHVLVIAGISLPLTSFSSIQMALLKRDFDFKSLFYARLIGICIPLFVTIPLAFIYHNYWALVIGAIVTNLSNAVVLSLRSEWKPNLFYNFKVLKDMFSFSSWSLIEQITIWITLYIGTFIVSRYLDLYYLGLYKNAMAIVNQIMALIAGAMMPVVFSALSRLQDDRKMFVSMFLKFQRLVTMFVLPLGFGIFIYRELITNILLGSQWTEVSEFIGLWALTSSLAIVFGYFSSEVYRALGKPKLSVLSQLLYLVILIPALIITAQISFEALYTARSLVIIPSIFINLTIMWFVIRISPFKMLKNIFPLIFSSLIMGIAAFGLRLISQHIVWSFVSIFICIVLYFSILIIFKSTRKEVIGVLRPCIVKLSNVLFRKKITYVEKKTI